MTAAVIVILLGLWVIYSGWRFYRHVNWDEPTESKERRKGHRRHRLRRQTDRFKR